ncbi:MAG: M20/M25/M40 family metallo-hydrolase, partial [Phycisphaerae bacterium]|nr:M20/M25/M40 family metallo-hydrolase [Phycisphaerae bacterium]
MAAIGSLEPRAVWEFFAGLAGVPRPSKKESRVREHVRSVAQQRGLTVREDAAGNLLIEVPASAGYESAPVVVLQGHLDMVCEKNAGTAHDFDNDPIRLVVDQDADTGETVVRADGTTLGADNGIGVAMIMAILEASDLEHGPIEGLFTVNEEDGFTGA